MFGSLNPIQVVNIVEILTEKIIVVFQTRIKRIYERCAWKSSTLPQYKKNDREKNWHIKTTGRSHRMPRRGPGLSGFRHVELIFSYVIKLMCITEVPISAVKKYIILTDVARQCSGHSCDGLVGYILTLQHCATLPKRRLLFLSLSHFYRYFGI